MKKGFYLGLILLLIFNASMISYAYYTEEAKCYFEEDLVCYDLALNQYLIEPDAKVVVQVVNEELKEAYQALWAKHHPEAMDVVSFVVDEAADIVLLDLHQAAVYSENLFQIDFRLRAHLLKDIAPELNYGALYYLPMHGKGFAFMSNISALEAMGYPYIDENNDFLHDQFEAFEAIFEAQGGFNPYFYQWGLSLQEPYAFYPYFTTYGWKLFPEYQGYEPGFHEPSFLEALRFIQMFSSYAWLPQEDQSAEAYQWDFDVMLEQDRFLFTQVAEFMYLDEYDEQHGSEWIISRFPAVEGQAPLQPFLYEVVGYALHASVEFPSAAHEVMRVMMGVEGLQAYVTHTQEALLRSKVILDQLVFDHPFTQQFAYAHIYARSEPLIALNNAPTTVAFRLYYDIDIMSVIRRLWNQEISPEQAQIEIAFASDAWLNNHALWNQKETPHDQE
jgi:hypothetical protein